MQLYMQIPYACFSSCQGFIANDYRNNDVNMRGETQWGEVCWTARCVISYAVKRCNPKKSVSMYHAAACNVHVFH